MFPSTADITHGAYLFIDTWYWLILESSWNLLKLPIHFLGKALNGVFALCHDLHPPSFIVVHHKMSGSYISRTVLPTITEFDTYIHTGLLCGCTGYDVTSYFWSEVIGKKLQNATSNGFGSNFSKRLKRGSWNLTHCWDNQPHKSAGYDVTSCFRSAATCN